MYPSHAEPTYGVAELCAEVKEAMSLAFPRLWVVGEAQRVRASRAGHLYFELVEKGRGDEIVGKLEAVVWRTHHQRIRRRLAAAGSEIAEGLELRCLGAIDFYGPFGRLQLVVREVDAEFALGSLERRRRETLAALEKAGLLEENRRLPLPPVPRTVALVTSLGSAAYHDFVSTLEGSGYGFRLLALDAAVQGRDAEREIASALAAAGRMRADCVALVRGGGSRTDLAVFDSRRVAEAVARCPLPVLAGLGHAIDRSIVDRVAHTSVGTPTKVAELLVERAAAADRAVVELAAALVRRAGDRLRRAAESVERAGRGVEVARLRLRGATVRLEELARAIETAAGRRLETARRRLDAVASRLASAAPREPTRRRRELALVGRRLAAASGVTLRRAREEVESRSRLVAQLSPERTLARGFSITRRADGGVVRDAAELAPGDRIGTTLARGVVASRVEAPGGEAAAGGERRGGQRGVGSG